MTHAQTWASYSALYRFGRLSGFSTKLQSSDWFRRSLCIVYHEKNGNFRSSALFYNYYNIFNIVSDLTCMIYNS